MDRLSKKGYKIALLDLPQSEGAKVAAEYGENALFTPADVFFNPICINEK